MATHAASLTSSQSALSTDIPVGYTALPIAASACGSALPEVVHAAKYCAQSPLSPSTLLHTRTTGFSSWNGFPAAKHVQDDLVRPPVDYSPNSTDVMMTPPDVRTSMYTPNFYSENGSEDGLGDRASTRDIYEDFSGPEPAPSFPANPATPSSPPVAGHPACSSFMHEWTRQTTEEPCSSNAWQYMGIISDMGDFERCKKEHAALNNKSKGVIDDVPKTAEEDRAYVARIFTAMTDFSDKEAVSRTGKSQLTRLRQLSNLDYEILAWEILSKTKKAHAGELGFSGWRMEKQPWKYAYFDSFRARFNEIEHNCRICKSLVYNLTEAKWPERFVSHPVAERASKLTNKRINERKGNVLKQVTVFSATDQRRKRPRTEMESLLKPSPGLGVKDW
ncbi:hypothetical protein OQA88_10887 [Cercophora sp. LCS_1]